MAINKSNFIKNLRRRIDYLNKNYGSSGFPSFDSSSSLKELRSISSSVKKSLDSAKRNKLLQAYSLAGNFISNPAKTEKGLRNQIKRQETRKQLKERKRAEFENRANKVVNKIRDYNKTVKFSKPSELIHIAPKNEKELKKAEEIIKHLDNKDKLSNLLKAKNNKLLKASTKMFSNSLYMAYVYTQTSIEQAYASTIPELGDLFSSGGVMLVEDLREQGFTLFEYANSLTDTSEDSEILLMKLASTIPFLSQRNKELVRNFVERMQK